MEKDLEEKLDAIYKSTEKTRKYFLASMIVTVVMIVLPLLGLIIIIPRVISSYMDILNI
ncbi:MAG: hypothetical protein BWY34_00268 [Parcubacteria group bacterium ADurb.Bin247]|jgi:hypothetical protein|nr:MAG: hypothetical protein BWY34_00268 [Parcubacteria group bacterium ADurb.Bin247]HQB85050.1 hypothetical protein [Candidatus Pacearchaeota archaeon]